MKPMDCVLKVDLMIPNSYPQLRGGLCGTPNLVELLIQLHTELTSPTWVTVVYSHNE
jgi:hypothetical protein